MLRQITDVIKTIREAIPTEEENLHSRLNSIEETAQYRAPELIGASWNELGVLVGQFADPSTPPKKDTWQMDAVCALTGQTPSIVANGRQDKKSIKRKKS